MRVGIDIRLLARGTRTGVEEYTINLVSHLVTLAPHIHFTFFYNALRKVELRFPWEALPNVEVRRFAFPNRALDLVLGNFSFPKIDKLIGGCDVFLSPHFFITPTSKQCKKLVVFHDLSFEYYPNLFSFSKRVWHARVNPRKTAMEATSIIAVSESTKEDLVNLYHINPKKIHVVYPAVHERFRHFPADEELGRVQKTYQLPEKFVLYFGTIEPRKNIIGVIKAFEFFKDFSPHAAPYALVVAGARGWLWEGIFRKARNSRYARDIIFTGFVDEHDKPYLYNLASVFVYPSFFEGFGFPPLEAMACGVPTIVSHVGSLPEVVGEGAIMVNPYIYGETARALHFLLDDERLYRLYRERGIKQAQKFSWEHSAKRVLELITHV